jgi:hypothetical protein
MATNAARHVPPGAPLALSARPALPQPRGGRAPAAAGPCLGARRRGFACEVDEGLGSEGLLWCGARRQRLPEGEAPPPQLVARHGPRAAARARPERGARGAAERGGPRDDARPELGPEGGESGEGAGDGSGERGACSDVGACEGSGGDRGVGDRGGGARDGARREGERGQGEGAGALELPEGVAGEGQGGEARGARGDIAAGVPARGVQRGKEVVHRHCPHRARPALRRSAREQARPAPRRERVGVGARREPSVHEPRAPGHTRACAQAPRVGRGRGGARQEGRGGAGPSGSWRLRPT